MDATELAGLLDSWRLALAAERKAAATIATYTQSVKHYLAWCGRSDPLDRQTLQQYVVGTIEGGAEPATARTRQQAIRRYTAWLADPDVAEIPADPFVGVKPPKLDTKVVQSLTADDLRVLIKACAGKQMWDRRDEAIIRLFAETGMRASEMVNLNTYDIDLGNGRVLIQRGKGGRGRLVGFSAVTAAAIDRYLRVRRRHRHAQDGALWLTRTSREPRLSYHGMRFALQNRAEAAGVVGFHIHKLRHTFASRWLSAGGSEGGLMAAAGWRSRAMVDRYTRATAGERAMQEARALGLGDL